MTERIPFTVAVKLTQRVISPYCLKVIGDLHIMCIKTSRRTSPVSRRRITGQGMTEYIIVLALVALTAVVAVGAFGDVIQNQFAAMGHALSGNKAGADASIAAGVAKAGVADGAASAAHGLGDYAQ